MKTTTSDGVEISWQRYGSGGAEPVILLHSLGADGGMWAPQIETLSAHRTVIAVDTRGHGRSSAPPGPYALTDLCADVLSVADDTGADRFHIVGLSLGGQMALWLASHQPGRVLSMAACNTAAKIGSAESWSDRIEAVQTQGMAALRPAVTARWFSDDFVDRHPGWFEAAGRTFEQTSRVGYVACCQALAAADLRADIGSIEAPSLIVGGEGDLSTPPEHARRLAETIPGARLEIIPGAAHLSNLDRRSAFDAALTGFLDTL